jgi:hypothetical protein
VSEPWLPDSFLKKAGCGAQSGRVTAQNPLREGIPMRPLGLLLTACLSSVLFYDLLAGRFPAVLAAAAPTSAAQSSPREETRLQKLQHLQATMDLLSVEYNQLNALQGKFDSLRTTVADEMFGERLDKDLRATWQRFERSPAAVYDEWKEHLPADKKDAMIAEDNKRKELINQKEEEYKKAIEDHQSEAAKALDTKLDKFPITKQYLNQKSFAELLERERLVAREALRQD